jgi:hypothetical protein
VATIFVAKNVKTRSGIANTSAGVLSKGLFSTVKVWDMKNHRET